LWVNKEVKEMWARQPRTVWDVGPVPILTTRDVGNRGRIREVGVRISRQ